MAARANCFASKSKPKGLQLLFALSHSPWQALALSVFHELSFYGLDPADRVSNGKPRLCQRLHSHWNTVPTEGIGERWVSNGPLER